GLRRLAPHPAPRGGGGMTALTSASQTARGLGALRASGVFIGRSLRHSLRDGEGLVTAVALPVVLLLMFTYVFGGAIIADGYIDFVVPGVILNCDGFGASSVDVAVNLDASHGSWLRFRYIHLP